MNAPPLGIIKLNVNTHILGPAHVCEKTESRICYISLYQKLFAAVFDTEAAELWRDAAAGLIWVGISNILSRSHSDQVQGYTQQTSAHLHVSHS